MSGWQGPPVLVGERALWLGSGSGLPRPAIVRWIGHLPEIGPDWTVGLELDEGLPVGGIDGTWRGRVLFSCKPRHGLIVPVSSIIPGSQLKHIPNPPGIKKDHNVRQINSGSLKISRHELLPSQSKPMVAGDQSLPRPALRHKRRIPTPPPSSDSDEGNGAIPTHLSDSNKCTLRVEERDQEDSLKKRLRLFTENNGIAQSMNSNYAQDVVIDSLYSQRHQQFMKHGRTQSESADGFISSASSSGCRRERNSSAIFSIFRWFRRESKSDDFDAEFSPSAPPSPQLIRGYSSSCGSVDTLFSTATANSFAFVHPALYHPFGAASPPEKRILAAPETDTYRNRLRQRDRIRELDKNLTLKKKYHLFSSGTLHKSVNDIKNSHYFLNKSLDSLKVNDRKPSSRNSTLGKKKRKAPPPPLENPEKHNIPITLDQDKENYNINLSTESHSPNRFINRPRHRRTVSDSAKDRKSGAFVHVKGKRKAPPPPVGSNNQTDDNHLKHEVLGTQSLGRKKRPAPPPPFEKESVENCETKSQGSLTAEEKQRLIDNIAKLQAHADRRSLLVSTPPASPTLSNKMPHTVCNDSLKLERGVLKSNKSEVQSPEIKSVTPTPVSPRPWYKRNSGNKEKSLEKKTKDKNKVDDWMPDVAIVRGSVINRDVNITSSTVSNINNISSSSNYRFSGFFSRFEKPEEKRKSQISMLVNISELDREAAEIVQREQEKEKAKLAAEDTKFYMTTPKISQEIIQPVKNEINDVEPSNNIFPENEEATKKTGARELISLFNAFSNVTKVTVNSAFFSKEGPSIFTKEGIEKRFSSANDSFKITEEKVISESSSNSKGYTREVVDFTAKEQYSESPGVNRRRNLHCMGARDDDSISSVSSGAASPKVVIEEMEEFDAEKSKTQVLYEANKLLKHHSPSPSIPTIAEMSESVSSVRTSPSLTITSNEKSTSVTPTPVTPSTATSVMSQEVSQPSKNYSIWSCPRCTLENPRWRVTCEACDMWRPAVRKDVIDKLTNANMGTTIAVNVFKAPEPQNANAVNKWTPPSKNVQNSTNGNNIKATDMVLNKKVIEVETKVSNTNTQSAFLSSRPAANSSKPMTVSGLLSNNNDQIKTTMSSFTNSSPTVDTTTATFAGATVVNGGASSSKPTTNNSNVINIIGDLPKPSKVEEKTVPKDTVPTDDSDMDEVRKARLAFFRKSLSLEKKDNSEDKEVAASAIPIVNQAKIDSLFSMTSKGSLATNEEERKKVKEILKEMKNSLPKLKQEKLKKENTTESIQVLSNASNDVSNEARLGAIKKSGVSPKSKASKNKKVPINNSPVVNNANKSAEVYLVKSETIIEEIKVKGNNASKLSKVSTCAQINGIVRQRDIDSSTTNDDSSKIVTGKPPTPKAVRKDIVVPVTVENHTIVDGNIHTTVTKEPRKLGMRSFELIRPRDFINIEATKTGNRVNPSLIHLYANVPPSQNGDSSGESSSSSSSDGLEVTKLTADLTKPKELADFKAAVLEGAAAVGDKMNTLAVNRLLRQLETAIAGGQHQRAATLAKQLAKHKVTCSVTQHKRHDLITVDMYVEDLLSHQGPFPLQLSSTITVAQLKRKVEKEFEIPVAVQRWILGKELAADDGASLELLGVTKPNTPVFLYLVAPDTGQDKTSRAEASSENASSSPKTSSAPTVETNAAAQEGATAPPGRGFYFNEEDDRYSFCESEVTDASSKSPSPERQADTVPSATDIPALEEVEVEEEEVEEVPLDEPMGAASLVELPQYPNPTGTLALGWKCGVCTLMNSPTRPGCLACAAERPADYRVPDNYEASGSEQQRIEQEQHSENAAAEDKLQNYQRLVVLEKADLIPSVEPFECSVCLTAFGAGDGVVLRDCLHTFCRTCLAHTVQFTDDAEVKCPFRDSSYACNSTLQEREIKAVCEDEEEDDSCIVCMAEPRSCALTPCGHRAYCETCCLRLIELDQMCSLCRRKADGYLLIYL